MTTMSEQSRWQHTGFAGRLWPGGVRDTLRRTQRHREARSAVAIQARGSGLPHYLRGSQW